MTGWNHLARHYKTLEIVSFGPFLQRARCAWILQLADRKRILLLGEGNGRFLAEALKIAPPDARFTVIDASEGMTASAKRRIGEAIDRVEFVHARLPEALTTVDHRGPFDAVTAHFFFDCFTTEDVSKIIKGVAVNMASEAIWLVSDFHIPDQPWWKRTASRFVVGSLYLVFRMITGLRTRRLPDWESAMRANGFAAPINAGTIIGFTRSDLWRRPPSASPTRNFPSPDP